MKFYNDTIKEIKNASLYYDKLSFRIQKNLKNDFKIIEKELEKLGKRNSFEEVERQKISQKIADKVNPKLKEIQITKIRPEVVSNQKNLNLQIKKEEKLTLNILKSVYEAKKLDEKKFSKRIYKENIKALEVDEIFEKLIPLREDMLKSLNNVQKKKSITIIAKNYTPFLIGAGIPSMDEIGFYWNRNYAVPTIPGSVIKGAFRHYLETMNKFEENEEIKKLIPIIFGKQDERGQIEFLEAIPKNNPKIFEEIQTPHFDDYYSNNNPPNDVKNPTPLSYLSVEENCEFRFDLIVNSKTIDDKTIERIRGLFLEFLEIYGLGAKTSNGYGRFEEVKN
ncbi:MAG: CRISPR-associated protein Cmr6 [Oceanotoga sp.]|uniref:type III-B CRISPR module RAMP protein Cmr6 n=1 Tax=Oceanotoga sp. TaxID=2108366 RepID=UPI002653A654|nr:type III-B CRISPR module RAMP protein Cmr6 [Oceanotoga sp.]MDN5342615.1 CRISPR-associated protein Cmr6 [Oceanotoga sp.]